MILKAQGITEILNKVKNSQEELDAKCRILLERLSQIGCDVASYGFKNAQYDGDNDVTVSTSWEGDKMVITARGQAVMFIEFGTGVTYTEEHPKAGEMGAIRGNYGQGKGSQNSWAYYGSAGSNGKVIRESDKGTVISTKGNPPARAMYDASKEMRNRISAIAMEVFKS